VSSPSSVCASIAGKIDAPLLGLVTLAYAFLLQLLGQDQKQARDWLIEHVCHRTGTHLREAELPFSRVRLALSKLWLASPLVFFLPNHRVRTTRKRKNPRVWEMAPCVFGVW
jgi:hypothetical protein